MIIGSARPKPQQRRWYWGWVRGAGRLASLLLLLAFLVVFFSSLLTRIPLFGYRATILAGGSMEPALDNGSLIISRQVAPEELKAGDVITFRYPQAKSTITHRIVAVREENGQRWFMTKGDANQTADPQEVGFDTGRPYRLMLAIPYWGYALAYIGSPQVILPAVALLLATMATMYVLGGGKGRRRAQGAQQGSD